MPTAKNNNNNSVNEHGCHVYLSETVEGSHARSVYSYT